MATRIADDPDSWGKPADLQRRMFPLAAGVLWCKGCFVRDGERHLADCPILIEGVAGTRCILCGVPWAYHDSMACYGRSEPQGG